MKHVFFEDEALALDRRDRAMRYRDGWKRVMDMAGALMLALLAGPLVAVLWCVVRLDGGPGFFAHRRVGLGGRSFRCWKLRTMCPDAETVLRAHLLADPDAAREWATTYKLARDPRVTRIGGILRRSSLDELPQLWNVLCGEMSLVGPRPVPPGELGAYGGAVWAYTSCRPGITGLWQVSGRNATSYSDRVRLDIRYLWRMGAWRDLAILARTPREILRRSGR
ncbi:sugar transferase [Anianabacter salinae]|uniref:sugar transferase n=1 Tax=Anianabacter salinae TaxID=2851023 RepID=UPI00225DF12C|nr:sugar transferase [Anianabacter salinae]MBV0911117.1 sugar transferase [Anianabacter salinae]